MLFWIGLLVGIVTSALAGALLARAAVRRAALRTRQAERRARDAERMAEIGAMTGGLAHEIKNPLSTIGLNAQLLAEGVSELETTPEQRDRLLRRIGVLRREVERLRGVLEDFLRYAGSVQLHPAPHDLNAIIEELADFFLPQAERSGVKLRTEPAEGGVRASVDPGYLKQGVLNLLLNAAQVMAADRAQDGSRPREIVLATHRVTIDGAPRAQITVRDTGPGIAPEKMEHIFAPYFTTRPGGAGLGLPITRRIVEAHAGTLEVESEPGQGATFTITLPVEQDTP